MDLKQLHHLKKVRYVLIGICILVVALIIFQAGMFVGYMKASFSFRHGDNYSRIFGPGPERGRDLPGGHGVLGTIVSINLPTLVVTGTDNVEKTIDLTDDTQIVHFRDRIEAATLKVGDSVLVLGSPNEQARIVAKLIRVK